MNSTFRPQFRAMYWKEVQENGRWAGLGLLGLSLSIAYTAMRDRGGNIGDVFMSLWNAVSLILTIGAPLVALALGLLQILPELRRDQWAFLVHRPASRSTLFWGKVAAGVTLYLLATGLPLLGIALLVRAPGIIPAPFDWRLTLGGLGPILGGLVFYFAGLLTALRPARWHGSRALPIPAAILCALCVATLPEFWQAAAVAVVFLGLFIPAARGSFLTTGAFTRQPRGSRFGLGVTLYAGILLTAVGAAVLIGTILSAVFQAPPPRYSFPEYGIDRAGRVLRYMVVNDGSGERLTQVSDLAGDHVMLPKGDRYSHYSNFLQMQTLLSAWRPSTQWPFNVPQDERYGAPGRYVTVLPFDPAQDILWYYLTGSRQFAVYSPRVTHRCTGYLGPNGFSTDAERAGRFDQPLEAHEQGPLFQFSHSVYFVDVSARRVLPLLTTSEPIAGATPTGDFYDGTGMEAFPKPLAVAVGSRFEVFSPGGRRLFTLPREHDPNVYADVAVAMTPGADRFFFWYTPRHRIGALNRLPSYVTEVTSGGSVVRRGRLPVLPETPPHTTNATVSLFGLLMPPVFWATLSAVGFVGRHTDSVFALWVWRTTKEYTSWAYLGAASALSGLLCAWLAWRIGRRCVFTRGGQWAWTMGAFCLGLPGVLLLLSLRDWPARETCPNCGRLRVVDRDRCEHCGAGFPAPTRDGTEIFEDGTRQPPRLVTSG